MPMTSLRTHTRADGGTSYYVKWYDRELKRDVSRSFRDRGKAEAMKLYLDANSNTLSVAAAAKRRSDTATTTVWDAVQDHITKARGITEGTRGSYRRNMDHHLQDTTLAGMPVEHVTTSDVESWVDSLTIRGGKPAAWKTRANVHAVVSAAFNRLVQDKHSPVTINPCVGALERDTNLDAREPVYLSKDDLRTIRERIDPHYSQFVWLLAASGLRFSEATALRRRDLHVMDGGRIVVQVRRAWRKSATGHIEIGPPKHGSRRDVALNTEVSAALIELAKDLALGDLVFQNPHGNRIISSRFHQDAWHPLMKELLAEGLLNAQPVPHEIRHAHCTHLLQDGVPVHVVQKRLGHKDPQTTLRVYARTQQADDLQAADAVNW